jgi:hypothetical protein
LEISKGRRKDSVYAVVLVSFTDQIKSFVLPTAERGTASTKLILNAAIKNAQRMSVYLNGQLGWARSTIKYLRRPASVLSKIS